MASDWSRLPPAASVRPQARPCPAAQFRRSAGEGVRRQDKHVRGPSPLEPELTVHKRLAPNCCPSPCMWDRVAGWSANHCSTHSVAAQLSGTAGDGGPRCRPPTHLTCQPVCSGRGNGPVAIHVVCCYQTFERLLFELSTLMFLRLMQDDSNPILGRKKTAFSIGARF